MYIFIRILKHYLANISYLSQHPFFMFILLKECNFVTVQCFYYRIHPDMIAAQCNTRDILMAIVFL